MEDAAEKSGTMQADIRNLGERVKEMHVTVKEMNEQWGASMQDIAVMSSNLADMKRDREKYQERCDAERLDHEFRLREVEGFQKRQVKLLVALGAAVSFFVTILTEWFSGRSGH